MGLFTNPLSHAGYPPGVTGTPSTLPSEVRAGTSAEVAAQVLNSVYVCPATVGVGQSAGTAPAAGMRGQQIRATVVQGSAVSLTTTTAANVTSISLTAGIWDVSGVVMLTGGAVTGTVFQAGISQNTASFTGAVLGDGQVESSSMPTAAADATLTIPSYRISLSATTTIYLVVEATFSGGSATAYGRISATRMA